MLENGEQNSEEKKTNGYQNCRQSRKFGSHFNWNLEPLEKEGQNSDKYNKMGYKTAKKPSICDSS